MTYWIFLLVYAGCAWGYGYDSGGDQAACGRPYRSGKMYQPPCDLEKQGYCTSAGKTYPWHAVKRFVKDNQGLMRRMYGDQRHGHVLRSELDDEVDILASKDQISRYARYEHQTDVDNDVFPYYDDDDEKEPSDNQPRYLKEDFTQEEVLRTKFVFPEQPIISIKLSALKTPHFRPTTQKTTKATTTTQKPEETTTDIPDINTTATTTDATTEETTSVKSNETEKTTEDEGATASTVRTEVTEGETEYKAADKMETMLYQDVANEDEKKKVYVSPNMKGINACPVKEEVVAPFWANNTRGEVLALLNMYPFEQYVHWEKCTFEHRQMYCREGCRCEQQYRLHRLLAYDPNNECRGIFSDWFRFPSCCVCKCYDMPMEFRVTSRSPRTHRDFFNN